MNEDDLARLHHMLDAAREAVSFSTGKTFDDFIRDRMLLLALVKDLEIVGEAASRTSAEARASIPEIPWGLVIGMRNRLTHGYFDWRTERIWETITLELPKLIHVLETALSSR